MALPTGVFLRGGVYWLRVLIPDDLKHLYPKTSAGKPPTDRYRASLRTADKGDARERATALRAEFEAEFNERRKSLGPGAIKPTPDIRAVLAGTVYALEMAADSQQRSDKALTVRMVSGVYVGEPSSRPALPEVSRLAPLPPETVQARAAFNRKRLEYVRQAVAAGNLEVMIPIAAKAAQVHGLHVDWNSPEGADALSACLEAYSRARGDATEKDSGMVIETPEIPKLPEAAQGRQDGPRYRVIRDLLPLWLQKAKPTPRAIEEANRALALLDASGVSSALKDLSQRHGAEFRDWLRDTEARGFSQKTGRNRFRSVAAILNAAPEYGAIPVNPWRGLSFPVEGARKRTPFTRTELLSIHSGPVFERYGIPEGDKTAGAAVYWMPLLGLYTGARDGELAQLEVADVREFDGVMVLDIHAEAERSTLKTENAVRRIPIHSELVRLGFLDYVETLRKSKVAKLFPTLHRGGRRTPGEVFTEAFREYLNGVGVTRPLATFHAYRHNVRSQLEAAEVSTLRIRRLIGHADDTVDARYTHLEIETMTKGVEKLSYPFLKLERVYPKP